MADLVKIASPDQWFIDSSGKLFTYSKTKMVPLIFRRIINVEQHTSFALISAQDVPGLHKCLYAPNQDQKYAGFLKVSSKSFVLYGFFEEQHKDTRRKI